MSAVVELFPDETALLESSIDGAGVTLGWPMKLHALRELHALETARGSFGPSAYHLARCALERDGLVEAHDLHRVQTGDRRYRLTAQGRAAIGK